MAQYSVPQFIQEEGKIVFFLTFRQFFLLVGGGALSFLLYYTIPIAISIPAAIFIMLVVSLIAFLKINNESIIQVIINFVKFSIGQKNYTWQRKTNTLQEIKIVTAPEPKTSVGPQVPAMKFEQGKLKAIKKMVEMRK